MGNLSVYPLDKEIARYLCKRFHYSNRNPSISYSFGLREGNRLVGCCVFSVPASYTLCYGLCGDDYKKQVLEISRVVILTRAPNAGSFFLSRCLRSVGNRIIVSYADPNDHVGHVGYLYQSLNFLYTGRGDAEPVWVDPRNGGVVSYTRRWIDRKAKAIGLHWQQLERRRQQGKHRYVYFTGDRRFVRKASSCLKYPVLPYPKGDTGRREIDRMLDVD